jgi:hypothetical protein
MREPLIEDRKTRDAVRAYLEEEMGFALFLKGSLTGVDRERYDAELNRLLQTHRDLCGEKE